MESPLTSRRTELVGRPSRESTIRQGQEQRGLTSRCRSLLKVQLHGGSSGRGVTGVSGTGRGGAAIGKARRNTTTGERWPFASHAREVERRPDEMHFDSGPLNRAALSIALPVLAGIMIALLYKAGFRISKVDSHW